MNTHNPATITATNGQPATPSYDDWSKFDGLTTDQAMLFGAANEWAPLANSIEINLGADLDDWRSMNADLQILLDCKSYSLHDASITTGLSVGWLRAWSAGRSVPYGNQKAA